MKPNMLFLSPTTPRLTGNGLAMRAGRMIQAFSNWYSISLLVVPVYPGPEIEEMDPAIASVCDNVIEFPPRERPDVSERGWIDQLRTRFSEPRQETPPELPFKTTRFDIVHLFRLSTLQVAEYYLHAPFRPFSQLDLDDLESITHRRLARLARRNHDVALGQHYDHLAAQFEQIERHMFRQVDRLFVCSEQDAALLEHAGPASIYVIPNTVELPDEVPEEQPTCPFRFLFVGTLGYYPNADGISWFARAIMPLLRETTDQYFVVDVAGSGASDDLQQLMQAAGINYVGEVPEMKTWYSQAHAVLVPVRAGGGTRIKVLEAFSWKRPVISTPVGVEGIPATHDREALIARDSQEFARACARLIDDRELRKRLGLAGQRLVNSGFGADRTIAELEKLQSTVHTDRGSRSNVLLPPAS